MTGIAIVNCFNFPDKKLRAYLHSASLHAAYSPSRNPSAAAREHLLDACDSHSGYLAEHDWNIALLWILQDGAKIIDFFGFSLGNAAWPGNPEVALRFLRDKDEIPAGTACEDGIILLAREAKWRRERSSLEDYLRNPPPFNYMHTGQMPRLKAVP